MREFFFLPFSLWKRETKKEKREREKKASSVMMAVCFFFFLFLLSRKNKEAKSAKIPGGITVTRY